MGEDPADEFNAVKCSATHVSPRGRNYLFRTSYILHGHYLETEEDSKYVGPLAKLRQANIGNVDSGVTGH